MKDTLIVTAGILVPFAALLIMGYIFYEYTVGLTEKENLVEHTILVTQKIEHLFLILSDAMNYQREYIIIGDDAYLASYNTTLSEYPVALNELRQLISDEPVQQENLDKLDSLVEKRFTIANSTMQVRDSQGIEAAAKIIGNGTGDRMMGNIRKVVTDMQNEEHNILIIRNKESEVSTVFTDNLIVYGTTIVSIITISIIFLTISNLRKRHLQIKKELEKQVESQKQELIHANEELKNKDISKGELIAMITHDLKTPLIPIQGYTSILLGEHLGHLNKEQKEKLTIIKSSTGTLLRLIKDLLDAQKLELGQLKLDKQVNSLSELIDGVVLNLKETTDKHGVIITKELFDVICFCDKERIGQVLTNLILNSVDFIPKNDGKITIKLFEEDNHAKIIVKDNGIGIDPNNLDKIFLKFHQVPTSITREHRGTGLGLSICKGIIENHGGKIWAESDGLDRGTEFHILLPKEIR